VEERITNGKGLVPQLLNNGELAQQVSQTTNDLRETMAKLKEGNGSLGKFLMGDEFLSRLNAVSAHTDSLLIQLGNPNGSLAKFTNDSTLYKNINGSALSAHRAISSLDSLLTDIKSNPKRYLHFSVF
jgi:phospholipid/cholesterol/gamma-HCH transport system substrate-binding protein